MLTLNIIDRSDDRNCWLDLSIVKKVKKIKKK